MLAAVVVVAAAWVTLVHAGPCWNLTYPECWFSATALLHGPPSQLGDYHSCVGRLRQQYCLVTVRLGPAADSAEHPSELWLNIQDAAASPTRYRRDVLERGLCTPLGATPEQVAAGVQEALVEAAQAAGVNATVHIEEGDCRTADGRPLDAADITVGCIVVFLIALVIVATTTEGMLRLKKKPTETKGIKLLLCFSMISNWRRLSQPPSRHVYMRCVQGMRFIDMTFIILGHRIILLEAAPIINPEFVEKTYGRVEWMTVINGHLVVITFFVISGMLLSFLFLEEVVNRKFRISYLWKAFVYRYLRLTPPYAITLAVAATLAIHAGQGPLWERLVGWDRINCRNHWWANMLYINNHVHASDTCLLQTWYLAADTQLFIVFLTFLMVLWRWPRQAPWLLAGCVGVSCLIPALVAYYMHLDPTLLSLPETVRSVTYDHTFLNSYVPAYMNGSPYAVGTVAGYLLHKHLRRGPDARLPKWAVALSWVLSLGLILPMLLSAFPFYQRSWERNDATSAAYQAFFRLLFSTGVASVLFSCTTGVGWFSNSVLSWGPFQPLGRLSYSAYLVHYTLQKCDFGQLHYEEHVSELGALSDWLSDVVRAYFWALLLSLFVEFPTSALFNMLLPSARRGRPDATKSNGAAVNGKGATNGTTNANGTATAAPIDMNGSTAGQVTWRIPAKAPVETCHL